MAEEDYNDKEKEDSDKDYGLPKIEITPIRQSEAPTGAPMVPLDPKETVPKVQPEKSTTPEKEDNLSGKAKITAGKEEKTGRRSWIIWLLLLLILGLGAWFYFNLNGDRDSDDNESQDQIAEPEPQTSDDIKKPLPSEPVEGPTPDEIPPGPAEKFTLTEISSRAGLPRYFVVVGSFIDEDLARDYSQELNQNGWNTFLVQPYGEINYHRLSIGHFDSFELAVKELDRIKADFDENLWVLKY
jgi:cell division septation protein DedD